MKIAHFITSLDRGGAENYLSCLVRGQIKYHQIFIIYLKGDGYWHNYLKSLGIKVIKLKSIFFFKKIFELRDFIKENKIDILHCHLSITEILGYFSILNNKNVKFLITKHVDNDYLGGSNKKNNSIFSRVLSHTIYKRADAIIAISKAVKKFLLDTHKNLNLETKIKTIYYGLDQFYIENCLFRKNKTMLDLDFNKVKFCFIGRLVKQKNVNNIIKVFSRLVKQFSNTTLVIVGNGPEKNNLKKLVKKLNIENNIHWHDFTDDVGSILEQIDVLCLSSFFEGLGLILLETMSVGKPIICPNVSAFPEVIKQNINGILVDSSKEDDYLNAMIHMIDQKNRQHFIENSKDILEKKFSFTTMVELTNEIYLK